MYYTVGLAECVHNLVNLATPFAIDGRIKGVDDLRGAVHGYLAKANGRDSGESFRMMRAADELRDAAQVFGLQTVAAEPDWAGQVAGGPRELALLHGAVAAVDPQLRMLMKMLFTDIALFDGEQINAGSGGILIRPGLVYFSPRPDWSTSDLAECLIHELTHLLLRFDELCHRHYVNSARTATIADFGRTAITGTPRAAHVVFHSFVIAAEIVALRHHAFGGIGNGVHGTAETLHRTAVTSGTDLLNRPDIEKHFTPRAITLIEHAMRTLQQRQPS